MKKILSLVIVLTLLLTMGVGVFAENLEESEYYNISKVTVNKEIILENQRTVHPAETFSFTIGDGVYNGPVADTAAPAFTPNTFTISVGKGSGSASSDIELPNFPAAGVYTYKITESGSDTAGMVYDNNEYYLEVTVINDGGDGFIKILTKYDGKDVKTDAFENTFKAGDLLINKTITGNFADFSDEFEVTVVLSPPSGKVIKEGPIAVSGASSGIGNVTKNNDGTVTVTFMIGHEDNVTIANIPYGVEYVVTEASGEYTETITGGEGTIEAASHSVEIVNTLNTAIETGINLDNLPYILILGAATIGLFGFTMKRRFNK